MESRFEVHNHPKNILRPNGWGNLTWTTYDEAGGNWLAAAILVTTLLYVLGDIGAPELGLVVLPWAGLLVVVQLRRHRKSNTPGIGENAEV